MSLLNASADEAIEQIVDTLEAHLLKKKEKLINLASTVEERHAGTERNLYKRFLRKMDEFHRLQIAVSSLHLVPQDTEGAAAERIDAPLQILKNSAVFSEGDIYQLERAVEHGNDCWDTKEMEKTADGLLASILRAH